MHSPANAADLFVDLPPDVVSSQLFNADLAPVPPSQRTWTTYNFAALWISMAHCIPTYMMAGGLVAVGMNWWQALATIALGNLIVLIPILLNAHPGTKYGIPFPVLARASFGTNGANVPALLRAVVACGWFGIQTFIGGEAVKTFIVAMVPEYANWGADLNLAGLSLSSAVTFFIFWGLNIFIIVRGMNAVRIFENWAAPIVLILAVVLMWWATDRSGGLGPMFSQPSRFETFGEFWKVFVPSLTGMIGFWATLSLNIPDFTRYGRGQREQMLGQTLGLPTTMVAFSAMGVVITSAAQSILRGVEVEKLWHPEYILGQLTSALPPPGLDAPLLESAVTRMVVAVVALFGVGIATISVNIAANVVSPANDFANLAPRLISFKTGGIITGVLGVAMMPWKLLASAESYIFNWLIGYSALLGPIAGIMVIDYWIIRQQSLDVPDLYRATGRYQRWNLRALTALLIGIAPNVPGFLKTTHVIQGDATFFDAIYPYAWFVGFFLSGFVYWFAMRKMSAGRVLLVLSAATSLYSCGPTTMQARLRDAERQAEKIQEELDAATKAADTLEPDDMKEALDDAKSRLLSENIDLHPEATLHKERYKELASRLAAVKQRREQRDLEEKLNKIRSKILPLAQALAELIASVQPSRPNKALTSKIESLAKDVKDELADARNLLEKDKDFATWAQSHLAKADKALELALTSKHALEFVTDIEEILLETTRQQQDAKTTRDLLKRRSILESAKSRLLECERKAVAAQKDALLTKGTWFIFEKNRSAEQVASLCKTTGQSIAKNIQRIPSTKPEKPEKPKKK